MVASQYVHGIRGAGSVKHFKTDAASQQPLPDHADLETGRMNEITGQL
jgi:hypothetical protein